MEYGNNSSNSEDGEKTLKNSKALKEDFMMAEMIRVWRKSDHRSNSWADGEDSGNESVLKLQRNSADFHVLKKFVQKSQEGDQSSSLTVALPWKLGDRHIIPHFEPFGERKKVLPVFYFNWNSLNILLTLCPLKIGKFLKYLLLLRVNIN